MDAAHRTDAALVGMRVQRKHGADTNIGRIKGIAREGDTPGETEVLVRWPRRTPDGPKEGMSYSYVTRNKLKNLTIITQEVSR